MVNAKYQSGDKLPISVTIPDSFIQMKKEFLEKLESENKKAAPTIRDLIEDYVNGNGKKVELPEEVIEKADLLAKENGMSIETILTQLLMAYVRADGLMVKVSDNFSLSGASIGAGTPAALSSQGSPVLPVMFPLSSHPYLV